MPQTGQINQGSWYRCRSEPWCNVKRELRELLVQWEDSPGGERQGCLLWMLPERHSSDGTDHWEGSIMTTCLSVA